MPAFGPSHTPDELWSLVTFIRALPNLTPEEKAALGQKGHGASHGEEPSPSPAQPATPPAANAKPGEVHHVRITGFKFDPPSIEVKVGDVVEWKNEDFVAHTATADDHSFDTGRIDAGETKRVTITRAGAAPYFCRYHLAMRGTVTAR